MCKVVVINGTGRMEKGITTRLQTSFIDGMKEAGAKVELFYANKIKANPCCGSLYCWFVKPGECIFQDEMQSVISVIKESDILVLATPVYVPLRSEFQNVLNRTVQIFEPIIEIRDGRTRARFHQSVALKKVVLIASGGWWEKDNCATVLRIAKEFTENGSIEFAGALIRTHANAMFVNGDDNGELTIDGKEILNTAKEAGYSLISKGMIPQEMFDSFSRPLIGEAEWLQIMNQMYLNAKSSLN